MEVQLRRELYTLTNSKLCVVVGGVRRGLVKLIKPPIIARHVLVILSVDGVHLTHHSALREEWTQEELSEPGHHVHLNATLITVV